VTVLRRPVTGGYCVNWELLTAPEFERAARKCKGVCLLPIGVLEKHGDHLPLGQDVIFSHAIATLAAQKELAIVFPQYYFGQIYEAKHQPGTIAIRSELLLSILESICDEISRNGLKKIILVNGHGGNSKMLPYFCQLMLEREKDYMVFFSEVYLGSPATNKLFKAKVDEHAGEKETSCMLVLRPELVKAGKTGNYGMPKERLAKLKKVGLYSGILWYSDHPGHYCSDGTPGTLAKGEALVRANVSHLAEQIRTVKRDTTTMRLHSEFYERANKPHTRSS
jgi:creatinine amidohydrolase